MCRHACLYFSLQNEFIHFAWPARAFAFSSYSISHLFYLGGLDICSISDSNFHELGMKVIFMLALVDFQGKIGFIFYYGL